MPKEKVADTLNALIDAADKADDESLVYQLRLLKCETEMYAHIVSPKGIEEDIESIIAYASDEQNQYMEAEALQLAGDYYIEYHKQSASLENYVAAYRIYQKFTPNDFPPKQDYVYTLGSAYYRLDDYENAIRYLQEALLIKNTRGKKLFYTINNTIGLSFRNMGQYDSAIWYFKRIYDSVSKEPSLNTWQHISGGNIGITFFLQKKYADATPLLEHDIETSIAHNQVKNAVKSMTIRAAIYYYYNDYSSAKDLLLKALTMARNKGFWDDYQLPEEIYGWLAKVYAAQKDMTQAYLYADSALVAKDSLMTENSSLNLAKANEKISYVQKKLDEERYNERLKLDQLALSKKRIEATFFFIGIVVLLLVVIFIARERKRSENILLNILPEQIAERLKKREHPIADYFDNASILFIDMAGFTSFSGTRDPKEVVTMLNKIFTNFDMLADKHGLEKIKTIGDCYMAVSGLPEPNPHHAEAAAAMAMEIKSEMGKYKASDGTPIQFRMGLDCGPVVAGVIGQRKFIYDLWGDTVNTASRMETTGIAGEIHCSDRFKKQLEGKYTFKSRGTIEIKGKGMMETWLMV
jgi:class 3 adenylate cyclase